MQKIPAFGGGALLCLVLTISHAQSVDSVTDKVLSFPSRLLARLQKKTTDLNNQLTQQTESYLQKMARREATMQQKLNGVDSNAAKSLFAGSAQQYAALQQQLKTDTGHQGQVLSGAYPAYLDSMQGSMGFLKQNPQLLSNAGPAQMSQLQGASGQLQMLQAKIGVADEAKAYMQQRKQMIADYIAQ